MEWMNIFDNEFVCICQREKRQRRFSKKKKNMHLTVNCEFNIGEILHLVCLEAKKGEIITLVCL